MRKNITLLLSLAFICLVISSFTLIKNDNRYFKKRGFVYIPSGTATIDGKSVSIQGFFMEAGEVTNAEYRGFLTDLKAQGRDADYEKAKIFSEKWKLPNTDMDAIVELYHTHPAYDSYPVVNITQEGARMYCEWLELQLQKDGYYVKVRLPELAEWQYAAKGGNDANIYAWEGTELRNKKGVYMANYQTESLSADGTYLTAISKSYFPNNFGLYNMSGNVSEWVSDTAMSKGGNWSSDPIFLQIDAKQEFGNSTMASPFIGFRPVFTYIGQ